MRESVCKGGACLGVVFFLRIPFVYDMIFSIKHGIFRVWHGKCKVQ